MPDRVGACMEAKRPAAGGVKLLEVNMGSGGEEFFFSREEAKRISDIDLPSSLRK